HRRPAGTRADGFAGAGGASFGHTKALRKAGITRGDLVAVNHDEAALATHKRNFPWATHHREDIKRVDPRIALKGKRARTLIGAPDCSDFSQGKGGAMMNEGVRSLAWDVVRWARLTQPDCVLVENVRGFSQWGPLYPRDHPVAKLQGRPIPNRRGEYFEAFLASLRALGYVVDWRLLRACDYGDPTSRVRLFVQAHREKVTWPAASHGDKDNLFGLPAHRTASEIIDWDLDPGESIFTRKKPLCEKTMARIAEGINDLS
ncbi:MAG: DNA cytosine methyltransferase, partial [Armatimonadota bacterium]